MKITLFWDQRQFRALIFASPWPISIVLNARTAQNSSVGLPFTSIVAIYLSAKKPMWTNVLMVWWASVGAGLGARFHSIVLIGLEVADVVRQHALLIGRPIGFQLHVLLHRRFRRIYLNLFAHAQFASLVGVLEEHFLGQHDHLRAAAHLEQWEHDYTYLLSI